MKGKKKTSWLPIISNLQLITAPINPHNKRHTKPYRLLLPNIVERAIRNINTKPKYISVDTIYLNQISLSYLEEKIYGLILNRKQSKEKIGKISKNIKK